MSNKKIKIVHIAQSAGGVSNYIEMLLKQIDNNKYSNVLICSNDYISNKFYSITEYVESIHMTRDISIYDLSAIYKIRKLIKKHNPDILYLHSSKAGALGRIASIGLKKIRIIYNAHGWAFNMKCSKLKKILYIKIEWLLSFLTDTIIAISKFEKVSALRYHICSYNKILLIENGINLTSIKNTDYNLKDLKKKFNIPYNSYVIGMVGRISHQKGVDIFIRMAKLLQHKISNVYFIIVGDGEDRLALEELIIKLDLDNILYITGWIDNPIEYIRIFDQAILLSRWEGFGLVLAEYMACRKAIVATNVDAIPYIISNNIDGLLVPIDNYTKAAEAVLSLYSNPNKKEKLIENAFNKVEKKFDIKRVSLEHEKLFHKLLRINH